MMIVEKQLFALRYKSTPPMPIFSCVAMSSEAVAYKKKLINEINNNLIMQRAHMSCALCKAEEAILIAEIDRYGIPTKTVICKECGLVFNDSYFSEESLESLYGNFYGKINFNGESPEESFLKRTRPDAPSWKRFAFIALNFGEKLKRIDTVFEIGCRDGCNLLPFHLAGKEVMGCDFDDEYLEVGRKRGLTLLRGSTDTLLNAGRKADLVILSHVLEHVIDVDKIISNIRQILKPDGYVYVEVPGIINWNRPRRDALREDGFSSTNNFLSYLQCVHNYHFELEKVAAFFVRNGFEMVYGDEWVRALFKNTGNIMPTISSNSAQKVLQHLREVERDYKSFTSRVYRLARKLYK